MKTQERKAMNLNDNQKRTILNLLHQELGAVKENHFRAGNDSHKEINHLQGIIHVLDPSFQVREVQPIDN